MANQIGANSRGVTDDEVIQRVSEHLRSFWTPEMIRTLQGAVDSGEAELDPLTAIGVASAAASLG